MRLPKYEIIPLGKIGPIAQRIAVAWVENFRPTGGIMLNHKHKLASDIMNYSKGVSIGFSEWTQRKGYLFYIKGEIWVNTNAVSQTTEQLFEQYLIQQDDNRDSS